MPYYRERQPWVVEIGYRRCTPEDPGPLSGAWAFAYGPLGECRHGELGLSYDPGIMLDNELVQVWETPDTSRPPDFLGVAGVVRGNDSLEAGAYTLAVVGLGDLDAAGLARYSAYGTQGAGYGLEPGPEETTEAFCNRILEPFANGGWGVRGDGARVVGVPSGGVDISPAEIHGYTSSGHQRREYVTETSCSPGGRWRRLYDSRPPPLPYAPRVYQAASSDNLVRVDVARAAQARMSVYRAEADGPLVLVEEGTDRAMSVGSSRPREDVSGPPGTDPPSETLNFAYGLYAQTQTRTMRVVGRFVIPLSDLVRGSESCRFAQDATYQLKSLRVPVVVEAFSAMNHENPPESYTVSVDSRTVAEGVVTFRAYLAKPGTGETIAVETDSQAKIVPGNQGGVFVSTPQTFSVDVPEDLLRDIFMSHNEGQYDFIVEIDVKQPPSYRFMETALRDARPIVLAQWGEMRVEAKLLPVVLNTDQLVDAIPPENYPPGWDAPSVSPPTAQGRVPGALIPPAYVTGAGQYVTEARVVRETTQMYTEIQTGARQTQKLLKAEKRLKTAVDNSQGRGGAW